MKLENIPKFLENCREGGHPKNSWFDLPHMQVYLRGCLHPPSTWVVDVANVVVEESHQRKKLYTKFLDDLEKVAIKKGYGAIRIENSLNKHLDAFYQRKGYVVSNKSEILKYNASPCYIKEINNG